MHAIDSVRRAALQYSVAQDDYHVSNEKVMALYAMVRDNDSMYSWKMWHLHIEVRTREQIQGESILIEWYIRKRKSQLIKLRAIRDVEWVTEEQKKKWQRAKSYDSLRKTAGTVLHRANRRPLFLWWWGEQKCTPVHYNAKGTVKYT